MNTNQCELANALITLKNLVCNLNEMSNATLEAWFLHHRPTFGPLDLIYVNGDPTLNTLKGQTESWTAQTIEPVFRELIFREEG